MKNFENKDSSVHWSSTLSALFLVAGCSIGGGMLLMPVKSGASGFFPSLFCMILVWAAMTISALLIVEAVFWMEEGVTIFSIAKKYLGPSGKWLCCLLFLYISYASVVAYAAGGGVQVAASLDYLFGLKIQEDIGCVLLTLILTGVIIMGGRFVGKINSLLFISLVASYILLVLLGSGEVQPSLLLESYWSRAHFSVPLLLTAFSFQTLVPSLSPILNRNLNAMRVAIIGGNTVSLVVYAIWQALILGIMPIEGPYGLVEAAINSVPVTHFIKEHLRSSWVVWVAEYFGFFALVTSFLGMGLGLFDFLADGFKWSKKGWHALVLGALIALPSIYFATNYEQVFIIAMETSGGYGDTLLNGMIPVAIVWIGRYYFGEKGWQVPGGKPLLVVTFLIFAVSFFLELAFQMGWISSFAEFIPLPPVHNLEKIID